MAVSDLPDVRGMKLITGKTLVYEAFLPDKTNDNSCSLVVYQGQPATEKTTSKISLLGSLVNHHLEQPFFDDLRT